MAAGFRANALSDSNGMSSGTVSTFSITIPSSAVAGDVALVVVSNNSNTTTVSTPPTGWALESGPQDNTSGNTWLYSKTIASGEPGTSVTWTMSAASRIVAAMTVMSGVTATGMTVATPNTDTSSVSSLTVPTIASTPAGAAVVALFGHARTANSGTPADVTVTSPYSQGTSERAASAFASGGLNVSTEVAYQIAGSAGSYGGESLAITGGTARGSSYLVALPVAGGGSTPATVVGVTAVVRAGAAAGSATAAATIVGSSANVRTGAQGGAPAAAATVTGATAKIAASGRPGSTVIISGTVVTGATALISVRAPAGAVTAPALLTGTTATVRMLSGAGAATVPVTVAGSTAVTLVRARAGSAAVVTAPRYSFWTGVEWQEVTAEVWNGSTWATPKVTVTPAD